MQIATDANGQFKLTGLPQGQAITLATNAARTLRIERSKSDGYRATVDTVVGVSGLEIRLPLDVGD
ncbi:MAG: hypothetical protein AAFN77_06130 [Planctomycetota bacterium]